MLSEILRYVVHFQGVGFSCSIETSDIWVGVKSKTPSLIFEYINNTDFRSLYPKFQDYDVRYYIFELLKVGVPDDGSDEGFSC